MRLEKKPKCYGCGKIGEEQFYWFQKDTRGSGGHLWHLSCAQNISTMINKEKQRKRWIEEIANSFNANIGKKIEVL